MSDGISSDAVTHLSRRPVGLRSGDPGATGPPDAGPPETGASQRRSLFSWAGGSPIEPTEPEMRISARLLLHIGRQPRIAPSEVAPESLTQAGMAAALGTSQAAVSHALRRLADGGLLEVRRSHVRGRRQRVLVYHLTEAGEALLRHIRESMGT